MNINDLFQNQIIEHIERTGHDEAETLYFFMRINGRLDVIRIERHNLTSCSLIPDPLYSKENSEVLNRKPQKLLPYLKSA